MELYSLVEAAEYLGIVPGTLKQHVYEAKTIEPQKVGNSLVFTKEQLDNFQKNRRRRGRPRGTVKRTYCPLPKVE